MTSLVLPESLEKFISSFAKDTNSYVKEYGGILFKDFLVIKANKEGTEFFLAPKNDIRGKGNFGVVLPITQKIRIINGRASLHLIENQFVAKIINLDSHLSKIEANITGRIYRTLCLVPAPQSKFCMIMENISGKPLNQYQLSWREKFRVAEDLATQLVNMENLGIKHRDIATKNIIYDPDYGARLIDFGAAEDNDNPNQSLGTPGYIPPEGISGHFSVDIYSVGVVFIELFGGELMWGAIDHSKCLSHMLNNKPVFLKNDEVRQIYNNFLKMLSFHPKNRPTAKKLLDYIKNLNEFMQKKELEYLNKKESHLRVLIEKFSSQKNFGSSRYYLFFKSEFSIKQRRYREEAKELVESILIDSHIHIKNRVSFVLKFLHMDLFTRHQRANSQGYTSSFSHIANLVVKTVNQDPTLSKSYVRGVLMDLRIITLKFNHSNIETQTGSSVEGFKSTP